MYMALKPGHNHARIEQLKYCTSRTLLYPARTHQSETGCHFQPFVPLMALHTTDDTRRTLVFQR